MVCVCVHIMLTFLPLRYWWLKLTALAEKEDWEEIEKFAKSKKSPIGYLVKRDMGFVIFSVI